ncbi:unnamed protein product [Pleuronectes platessa]|uniref:Uncharacterized protein n=1 Tax=Pleuronectes platessa TaxID=8262 RepID=A0A9N7W182_PLEPL|nr:unnamed protein product [Pleuronectes platessa]
MLGSARAVLQTTGSSRRNLRLKLRHGPECNLTETRECEGETVIAAGEKDEEHAGIDDSMYDPRTAGGLSGAKGWHLLRPKTLALVEPPGWRAALAAGRKKRATSKWKRDQRPANNTRHSRQGRVEHQPKELRRKVPVEVLRTRPDNDQPHVALHPSDTGTNIYDWRAMKTEGGLCKKRDEACAKHMSSKLL